MIKIKIAFFILITLLTSLLYPYDYNETRRIHAIFPQGDWDFWLLGYHIYLDDGTSWFTYRGPIDYWDWEVGDEVKIEPYKTLEERKLILPWVGYTECRIVNITRNDLDDFRAYPP